MASRAANSCAGSGCEIIGHFEAAIYIYLDGALQNLQYQRSSGGEILIFALTTELLEFFALPFNFGLVGVHLALLIGLSVLLSLELITN